MPGYWLLIVKNGDRFAGEILECWLSAVLDTDKTATVHYGIPVHLSSVPEYPLGIRTSWRCLPYISVALCFSRCRVIVFGCVYDQRWSDHADTVLLDTTAVLVREHFRRMKISEKIRDVFDADGQLDSIAPSTRSNPTARRRRKHLEFFPKSSCKSSVTQQ